MQAKGIFSSSSACVEGILSSNPAGVHGWELPKQMQSCFIYWNLMLRVGFQGSVDSAVGGLRDDAWQGNFTCEHVFGIKPPTCLEGLEQRHNFCLYCSRVIVSGKSTLGFLHLLPSVPPLLQPTSRLVVNFDMHNIKTSFIWKWSLMHLFRRKSCHAVSVKGRKTKVSWRNFTDAHVLGLIQWKS